MLWDLSELASPKNRFNECKQSYTAGIASHAYKLVFSLKLIRSDFSWQRVNSLVLSFINQVEDWLLS